MSFASPIHIGEVGNQWLAVSHDLLGKSCVRRCGGTNGEATLPKAVRAG
jgi:hypothetical protein